MSFYYRISHEKTCDIDSEWIGWKKREIQWEEEFFHDIHMHKTDWKKGIRETWEPLKNKRHAELFINNITNVSKASHSLQYFLNLSAKNLKRLSYTKGQSLNRLFARNLNRAIGKIEGVKLTFDKFSRLETTRSWQNSFDNFITLFNLIM